MSESKLNKRLFSDQLSKICGTTIIIELQELFNIIALIEIRESIDEAQKKICESIDSFVNAKLTSDKVMQGVLKDIRASIDDVRKEP